MSKSILRSTITFIVIIVVLSVIPFGCTCGKKPPSDNAADNTNPGSTNDDTGTGVGDVVGGGTGTGGDNVAGNNVDLAGNVAGGGTGTGGGNVVGGGDGTGTGGGNVVGGGDGTGTGAGGGNVVGGGDDNNAPRGGYVGNLILEPEPVGYIKDVIWKPVGNGNKRSILVAADGLKPGLRTGPLSDADDNNRGFDDLRHPTHMRGLFTLRFPGDKPALFFINRTKPMEFFSSSTNDRQHVTTNRLALTAVNTCVNSSESADNAVAAQDGGGTCRRYDENGQSLINYNYLGTVFSIPPLRRGILLVPYDQTAARGTMRCTSFLRSRGADGYLSTINDTTIFNELTLARCSLGIINSAAPGFEDAAINEAWVDAVHQFPSTTMIRTAEIYAIGINIEGKTISQWSTESGFNKAMFDGELDNAAMKKILAENQWADLLFTVVLKNDWAFDAVKGIAGR